MKTSRAIVVAVVLLGLVAGAVVFLWPRPEIVDLRTSKGYTVRITVTNEWTERDLDLGDKRPVSCEVLVRGATVVPARYTGCTHLSALPVRFRLIEARDGDIVGVVEQSTPSVVLYLYDFSRGTMWPGGSSAEAKALLTHFEAPKSEPYVLAEKTDRGKVIP